MTNMASFSQERENSDFDAQDEQHYFQINVPTPGNPPLMVFSGNEAYSHILEVVRTNKFLSERANEIDVKATEIVEALRSLANLLNLKRNKTDETNQNLAKIEYFVKVAENNIDLAFKVKRVRLLKFDTENHLEAETDLATAEREIEFLKEDIADYLKKSSELEATRKVIQDCIDIGFDVLAIR